MSFDRVATLYDSSELNCMGRAGGAVGHSVVHFRCGYIKCINQCRDYITATTYAGSTDEEAVYETVLCQRSF